MVALHPKPKHTPKHTAKLRPSFDAQPAWQSLEDSGQFGAYLVQEGHKILRRLVACILKDAVFKAAVKLYPMRALEGVRGVRLRAQILFLKRATRYWIYAQMLEQIQDMPAEKPKISAMQRQIKAPPVLQRSRRIKALETSKTSRASCVESSEPQASCASQDFRPRVSLKLPFAMPKKPSENTEFENTESEVLKRLEGAEATQNSKPNQAFSLSKSVEKRPKMGQAYVDLKRLEAILEQPEYFVQKMARKYTRRIEARKTEARQAKVCIRFETLKPLSQDPAKSPAFGYYDVPIWWMQLGQYLTIKLPDV